jgi:hypothetical protein
MTEMKYYNKLLNIFWYPFHVTMQYSSDWHHESIFIHHVKSGPESV